MLLDATLESFQLQFKQHLESMLSPDELGAFILVLANSLQDESLREALQPGIVATFDALRENLLAQRLAAGPDDIAVFKALIDVGIDQFQAWETRNIGPWRASFNPLRALRPKRASSEVFSSLIKPFDEQRFHFDKPFLKAEIISEESFEGHSLRVMYHKFPFTDYHLLLVLDADQHLPQVWSQCRHEWVWRLHETLSKNLPGLGLAFNSVGASASVNHLHIHGFLQSQALSIEHHGWQHNGGTDAYPLAVFAFDSAVDSWSLLEHYHRGNQPYNLLFRQSRCFLIPRAAQGTTELPEWMPDAGWYELCGGFNLTQSEHFSGLQSQAIEQALSALTTA